MKRWIPLVVGFIGLSTASIAAAMTPAALPRDVWAAPGRLPLSDRAAAMLVIHQPENRPQNIQFNRYWPTSRELNAFYHARTAHGRSILKIVPEYRYVTGRSYLRNPSTNDLIQWAARKWGIPTHVFHAQVFFESLDLQTLPGDRSTVSRREYFATPRRYRIKP